MLDTMNILDILKANPQIAPDDLERHRAMLIELRTSGARRSGYRLVPSYAGKRALVQEDRNESRGVRLRHSSERA